MSPRTSQLIHEQDFYDLAMAYFKRAAEDGVRYAEIFFDPQTHTDRGIAFKTVINGLVRAQQHAEATLHVKSGLIMCFLRHDTEEAAFKTLEAARPFLKSILGVGLDSGEKDNPPEKFARVFAKCRELNLHIVAHAGEEGPASYITEALDVLKVERIDHGVRCLEVWPSFVLCSCCDARALTLCVAGYNFWQDDAVVARLVKEQVPLTVCPLSNHCLQVRHREPRNVPRPRPHDVLRRLLGVWGVWAGVLALLWRQERREAAHVARPGRHHQQRRPGVFRWLHRRQLRGVCGGAGAGPRCVGGARDQQLHVDLPERRGEGGVGRGGSRVRSVELVARA